jgi:glycosyltransferase involved in cell wall biosynthesis
MTDKHKSLPLVSIYMPTHNRLHLLKRAVASVLAQTYQYYELLIVDDGSTDGTWDYLQELSSHEPKVRIFRSAVASGACAARNVAINEAQGELITGLDDDDEFLVDRLDNLVKAYTPDYAFVCHGFFWDYGAVRKAVDSTAMVIKLNDLLNYNFAGNQILTATEKLRQVGGFDPQFKACQDYDTWTRMVLMFGPAKRIAGASYIVHQSHEGPRVTAKQNKFIGYQQYFDKHSKHMSVKNKVNQDFMRLVAARSHLSLGQLLFQLKSGFIRRKLRYYLACRFSKLAQLRRKWLRGSS